MYQHYVHIAFVSNIINITIWNTVHSIPKSLLNYNSWITLSGFLFLCTLSVLVFLCTLSVLVFFLYTVWVLGLFLRNFSLLYFLRTLSSFDLIIFCTQSEHNFGMVSSVTPASMPYVGAVFYRLMWLVLNIC